MFKKRKLRSKGRPPGFKKPGAVKSRPYVINMVRLQAGDPTGREARLVFSWDMIERLIKLRDGKHGKLHNLNWDTLYLDVLPFADMSVPGVFVRLRPLEFSPLGFKLYKPPGRHTFMMRARAKHLWLKPVAAPKRLKTLWVTEPAGLMVVFDDADMLYEQHPPLNEKPPGV